MDKCLICRYDKTNPSSFEPSCTTCDGITAFAVSPARLFAFVGLKAWLVDQKRVIPVQITGFTYRDDGGLYIFAAGEGEERRIHIDNLGRVLFFRESEARRKAAEN